MRVKLVACQVPGCETVMTSDSPSYNLRHR